MTREQPFRQGPPHAQAHQHSGLQPRQQQQYPVPHQLQQQQQHRHQHQPHLPPPPPAMPVQCLEPPINWNASTTEAWLRATLAQSQIEADPAPLIMAGGALASLEKDDFMTFVGPSAGLVLFRKFRQLVDGVPVQQSSGKAYVPPHVRLGIAKSPTRQKGAQPKGRRARKSSSSAENDDPRQGKGKAGGKGQEHAAVKPSKEHQSGGSEKASDAAAAPNKQAAVGDALNDGVVTKGEASQAEADQDKNAQPADEVAAEASKAVQKPGKGKDKRGMRAIESVNWRARASSPKASSAKTDSVRLARGPSSPTTRSNRPHFGAPVSEEATSPLNAHNAFSLLEPDETG